MGLVELGSMPEGLCDGVCPGVLNDDDRMSRNTNRVHHLAPTWQPVRVSGARGVILGTRNLIEFEHHWSRVQGNIYYNVRYYEI